ncbi:helix-turn-helix transcriptional regulator [Streptomyces sp. NPDC054796]
MSDGRHKKHSLFSCELGDHLTTWRERLDPTRIPGVDTSRRRLKPGLTQQEVATLTGVSVTWYRELEGGKQRHFSEDFLQRLAMTLRLDQTERVMLFRMTLGYAPPSSGLSPEAYADEGMQTILDQMLPHPAYLSDLAWNIVAHNQPQEDWFPWIPYERNLMRWAFLYPEAREQLVNWRSEWAAPFLAQLRFTMVSHRKSKELIRLRDEILDGNAEARELWAANESLAHPDGAVRRFRLPHHGGQEIHVKINAFVPISATDMRFVVLLRV